MSTILPYFKFNPGEYTLGSVIHESDEIQGIFIRACSMYWGKGCNMKYDELVNRLGESRVTKLVTKSLVSKRRNRVHISFLDEQHAELSEKHTLRVQAGRKGGLSNAKAMVKQSPSIKIRKEEDKIIEDAKPPTKGKGTLGKENLEYFLNTSKLIESIKSVGKGWGIETGKKAYADFHNLQSIADKKYETEGDVMSHFVNWLRKQEVKVDPKDAQRKQLADGLASGYHDQEYVDASYKAYNL